MDLVLMKAWLNKSLVVLPVVLLGYYYLHDHYRDVYGHLGTTRLALLGLTLLVLYGWIFLEVIRRRQNSFVDIGMQASFFVYVFMVLTLTGYFVLFREISVHHWWANMIKRFEKRDHVNLVLFKVFKIYKITDRQVVGNFIMLLPMGIYLPILYKRVSNLFLVLLICFLISASIEMLQLITSFRSADVDDVWLNTIGAGIGFMLYWVAKKIIL